MGESPNGLVIRDEDDRLLFLWRDYGFGFGFERLIESSEGIHAEIQVKTVAALETGAKGHVHRSRVNLVSTTSKKSLLTHLAGRVGEVPWHDMLEIACEHAIERMRKGEPFVDLSTIQTSEDVPYLIRDFLPEGETSVLYAAGGSAKSYLALAIALAAKLGQPIGGLFSPTKHVEVAYLDWETRAATHARRLRYLCNGLGVAPPTIHYRRQHRTLADDIGQIRRFCRQREIGLLIVDSLGPACGGEQEKAVAAIPALNSLRTIGEITCLVISHMSRAQIGQETGPAKPFGSVFVENLARMCWEVRRAQSYGKDSLDLGLFCTKVNDGRPPAPLGVRVSWDTAGSVVRLGRIDVLADAELAAHGSNADRVIACLRSGAEMKTKEVGDAAHLSTDIARTTLGRLATAGQIVRVSDGIWRRNDAT